MKFTSIELKNIRALVVEFQQAQVLEKAFTVEAQLEVIKNRLELAEKKAMQSVSGSADPDLGSAEYILIKRAIPRDHIDVIRRINKAIAERQSAEDFSNGI